MAITPGTSFGLCSKSSNYTDLNGEKKALYDAALKYFEEVFLIDPQNIHYYFERGTTRPRLLYEGRDIADLTVVMIRSTGGRVASSAMLAHTLDYCGCNIVDPLERFSVGYASKLLTTINRFERGVGSNSYIAFGAPNAALLLETLDISEQNPILYKPVAGRKGEGVTSFTSKEQAQEFIQTATAIFTDQEMPYLFQTMEHFVTEYRVMVMNGDVLGIVQKIRAAGAITANAAQRGTFIAVENPAIAAFAKEHISNCGLVGADIAIDDEGAIHIIEANRAPMWAAFEEATGVKVAEEVVMRLSK